VNIVKPDASAESPFNSNKALPLQTILNSSPTLAVGTMSIEA